MNTSVEIPHSIVRELKERKMKISDIGVLYHKFIEHELETYDDSKVLDRFETFIESNNDELIKDFPVLKQEVKLDYD